MTLGSLNESSGVIIKDKRITAFIHPVGDLTKVKLKLI